MGKSKTDRIEQLRQAAKRFIIAQEVQGRIEQHNLKRLVNTGVLVRDDSNQQTN